LKSTTAEQASKSSMQKPTRSRLGEGCNFWEIPTMRRANAASVEFMHAHSVSGAWGDSKDCAADAMSLDVSRHVWVARTDPKRQEARLNFSYCSYENLTP
jgi:hypothetical protein